MLLGDSHLAVQPPSENNDEKLFSDELFSDEVFKDNLDFGGDIEKLPL